MASALPATNPSEATGLQWLYVDFNSYFASVEQQLQPELRGKPIIVVPVASDTTSAIAASYEAKAFGIRTGTNVREAKIKCPGLICVPARHEVYVDFHHKILEEIDRHIPVTAVCSIDEVACRLMRNETSLAAVARIAASIKRGLAENVGEHVRCSIGVAPNRYLAKVATDLKKPDGFTVIHPHDLPHRLFALDLRDLPGVGPNMERRLTAAGIADLPALWALGAERMRHIWGSIWGERMWHLLRGADLPEMETQRSSLNHSQVLAPDLRVPIKARHVARRLLLKAASRLRRMDYYASALSFSARLENGGRIEESARFWRAQDSMTFLHKLDELWTRALPQAAGTRFKMVVVTVHRLSAASELAADLFDTPSGADSEQRAKAERMSRALDKLNHRFGRDTVQLGALPADCRDHSGAKIAFTRIPDRAEFLE
ncbi:DNA polymerase IV [Alphaproteobacteria bacterium SO-S41]|nr:DNA polymerase IV [Alphaproteobacteria bacterium SO-S41]